MFKSEWDIRSLESLCRKITSGGTPLRSKTEFYTGGTIPWYKTQELKDWYLEDSQEHITNEALASSSAKLFPPGTILMAMYGDGKTITSLGILRRPSASNQACCAFIVDPEEASYLYLFYALKYYRPNLIHLATGGAQRNLSGALIRSFKIAVPPRKEQEAIAEILGVLDSKIELNRSMSQTLEATARVIFKSWFVDFDPVRRRQPLFPRRFTESALGEIPEGWNVTELGVLVEVIDCLHSKKPERQLQGRPLLQLNNILDSGLLDMTDTYFISEEDYSLWTSRMEARAGDCVITNVGRVGAVAQIPEGLKAALGRNMTGLRCRAAFPFPTFLIECLLSSTMREEIASKVDAGTILESLNVRNIPRLRVIEPSKPVATEFERVCRPLRAKMERNLEESRALAALRDALLPKLLSGEIRVKQAEKIVDEAV